MEPDHPVVRAGAAFEMLQAFALFTTMSWMARPFDAASELFTSTTPIGTPNTVGAARPDDSARGSPSSSATSRSSTPTSSSSAAPPAATELWNELRIELNIGQYLDIVGSAARERRRPATERIARYKSGKYTIERPLHVGAAMAEPPNLSEVIAALSSYGLPLGDAFQYRDDVLGAFGDEATTGKPVGDDLVEGKPTPLLAIATERATSEQLVILDLVGRPGIGRVEVAAIQQVLVDTGALDELESGIRSLANKRLPLCARHHSPTTPRTGSSSWPSSSHGASRRVGRLTMKVIVVGAGLGGLAAAAHARRSRPRRFHRRAIGPSGRPSRDHRVARLPDRQRPDRAHDARPSP